MTNSDCTTGKVEREEEEEGKGATGGRESLNQVLVHSSGLLSLAAAAAAIKLGAVKTPRR